MLETKTIWDDSGHDCKHCGGEVLRRTDYLLNGLTDISLQCRECGCQWTLEGEWLRVGNGRSCRTAHHQQSNPMNLPGPLNQLSRRFWVGAGIVLLILMARWGGIGFLRYLLPLVVLGFVAWTLVRFGKEYHWW